MSYHKNQKTCFFSLKGITILIAFISNPCAMQAQYHKYTEFCLDSSKVEREVFQKRIQLFDEWSQQRSQNGFESSVSSLEDKAFLEFMLDTFSINERIRVIENWIDYVSNEESDDTDTLCSSAIGFYRGDRTTQLLILDFYQQGYVELIKKYDKKILEMLVKPNRKLMMKEITKWNDWHLARVEILYNDMDEAYDGGGNHVILTYPTTEVEWLLNRVIILGDRYIGLKLNESMHSDY
jgi:hypothetical protein